MLSALTNRKKAVLPTAIKIFNKLQDKYVNTTSLEDYADKKEDVDHETGFARTEDRIEDINQSMNKLELLINDPSSPILSAIRSAEKYDGQKLPATLHMYVQ